MQIDWKNIQNQYVNGGESLAQLANRLSIPLGQLKKKSAQEKWGEKRRTTQSGDQPPAGGVSPEDSIARMTVMLLEKLMQAAQELDQYTTVSKTRRKETDYNEKGKTVGETVTETEVRESYRDTIDRGGLKQLTAALKDLKDIQLSLTGEEEEGTSGVVEIAALLEDLAKGEQHG